MKVIKTISEYSDWLKSKPLGQIGFIPTMGALHKGHASLIQQARKENDFVVVSIYVNPLQFLPGEDFQKYPRPVEKDLQLCEKEKADVVFLPNAQEMQVSEEEKLSAGKLGKILEGKTRPGHFDGVCTIVNKFFKIIQPKKAYFGMKDLQQLILIENLIREQKFPIKLVRCPTVREKDGLALSSRNIYLASEERKQAVVLNKAMKKAKTKFKKGEKNSEKLKEIVCNEIKKSVLAKIDYVDIVNQELQLVQKAKKGDFIGLAVWFGKTRLIDNLEL